MGLLDKLRQGLTKTKNLLKTDIRDLFELQAKLELEGHRSGEAVSPTKLGVGGPPRAEGPRRTDDRLFARVVDSLTAGPQ